MENNNSFVKQYYLFILFTMYRNPWLQICWFSCALGVKQIAHEAVWIPLWFSPPIRVHQENLKECLKNPHEIYQLTNLHGNLQTPFRTRDLRGYSLIFPLLSLSWLSSRVC